MPVQSWGHSQYWAGPSTPEIPPTAGASGSGGYVTWQTTVIVGSVFGALQLAYEWALARVRRDGSVIR